MNNRHRLIILLAVVLLSACAQFTRYRTEVPDPMSADYAPFKCKVDESKPTLVDEKTPTIALGGAMSRSLLNAPVDFGRSRQWGRLEVGAPSAPRWRRTLGFYLNNGFKEVGPRLRRML